MKIFTEKINEDYLMKVYFNNSIIKVYYYFKYIILMKKYYRNFNDLIESYYNK